MDKKQWQKAKAIFNDASLLEKAQRAAFVKQQAAGDDTLIEQVMSMLASDESSTSGDENSLTNIVSNTVTDAFEPAFLFSQGDKVEQFTIQSMLGEGGMGSVYLAKRDQQDFEQWVAIKVIHKQQTSRQSITRFIRERQILASLNHKHIANFISGGETEIGLPYIILQYINGVPITDYCIDNKLSVKARLALFKQVLSAVKYAHQNLVVHRDIKPSNVLVDQHGEVKLLDFGIAKLLQNDDEISSGAVSNNPDLTQQAMRVLTPSNASPEQVLGNTVTTRSDIYGLGSLLMHMLSDQPVFDITQRSSREIEEMILDQSPIKPSAKCAASNKPEINGRANTLKGDLDTIVLHALHKDPERRYSSVEQLEEDIRRYEANYPIVASPDSITYHCKKFIKRNSLATALSTSLLLALLTFSGLIFYQSHQISIERDKALEQADIALQTSNFITDLFRKAGVNESNAQDVSAMQVLAQAEKEIDELETTKTIKSKILLSIAIVYTQIDDFEKSLVLLARANELNESATDASASVYAENTFRINLEIADVNMLIGNSELAIQLMLSLRERLKGFISQQLFEDQEALDLNRAMEYALAVAYNYEDDTENSAIHLKNAIDFASQSTKEPVPPIFYITYGGLLRDLSRFEESKASLYKSVELERAAADEPSLDLAYALNQLAATLELLDELDAGIEAAKEGLSIRAGILGESHVESISSAGMLSNLYAGTGQFAKAITIRERVLEAMEEDDKTGHPYYAITYGSLANLYKRDGKLAKAKTGLARAHRLLNDFFTDGHPEVARPLIILAEIALLESNITVAEDYLKQAKTILDEEVNGPHVLTGMQLALESVILRAQNLPNEAEQKQQAALRMYKRLYGESSKRYQGLIDLIADTSINI